MSTENGTSLRASVRHAAPVAVQKDGKWLMGREKNLLTTTPGCLELLQLRVAYWVVRRPMRGRAIGKWENRLKQMLYRLGHAPAGRRLGMGVTNFMNRGSASES